MKLLARLLCSPVMIPCCRALKTCLILAHAIMAKDPYQAQSLLRIVLMYSSYEKT